MPDAVDPNALVTHALIEAMGSAVVLLDMQGVAQALSPAMRALMPALVRRAAVRALGRLQRPDQLDAIVAAVPAP